MVHLTTPLVHWSAGDIKRLKKLKDFINNVRHENFEDDVRKHTGLSTMSPGMSPRSPRPSPNLETLETPRRTTQASRSASACLLWVALMCSHRIRCEASGRAGRPLRDGFGDCDCC